MLSEAQVVELTEFISNNRPSKYDDYSISNFDLENGKEIYERMKTEKGDIYEIFGSDALGYLCYSLFKDGKNKIYLISVSMDRLSSYCELPIWPY